MPPKGWRKNADGQYPQPSKDQDYVSIDEILFPRSVVQRLAKQLLNGEEGSLNMSLSKDSLIALQRSATVFVSHMMFHARLLARDADRKTVNVQDIIGALERSEYGGFVPEVKNQVALFESEVQQKKKNKAAGVSVAAVVTENGDSTTKRLKDNNEVAHLVTADSDVEDTVEQAEETEEAEQDETKEEESGSEDEQVAVNPISVLGEEEDELHGDEAPEEVKNEDEEDDEDEN